MGSGCSAPDTGIKNINPTVVHGKTVEGTDLQIQQMMALSEDGSNFKVKVEVIEGPHKGEHHVFLLHPGKEVRNGCPGEISAQWRALAQRFAFA